VVLVMPPPDAPPATVYVRPRRPMREIGPEEAYAYAIEQDSLDGYVEYVEDYPNSPYVPRVWAIIRARREALSWMRALALNTPPAYWTYLRRYPDGIYAADAMRRLRWLSAANQPPPNFVPVDFYGVPMPLQGEPAHYVKVYHAPPPPATLIAPPPPMFARLGPPPAAEHKGVLPSLKTMPVIIAPKTVTLPSKPLNVQPNVIVNTPQGGTQAGGHPTGAKFDHPSGNVITPASPTVGTGVTTGTPQTGAKVITPGNTLVNAPSNTPSGNTPTNLPAGPKFKQVPVGNAITTTTPTTGSGTVTTGTPPTGAKVITPNTLVNTPSGNTATTNMPPGPKLRQTPTSTGVTTNSSTGTGTATGTGTSSGVKLNAPIVTPPKPPTPPSQINPQALQKLNMPPQTPPPPTGGSPKKCVVENGVQVCK
jgi:hypothetical protein